MSEFVRKCPKCGDDVFHKNKYKLNFAIKQKSLCRSCGYNHRPVPSEETRKKMSISHKGEKNGFYGKSHSNETKDKIRKKHSENIESYTSDEFREKMKSVTKGEKNGMYGRNFYEVWLDKYGKIEADRLLTEFKRKQSENNTGEKNHMFGKPSPQGSGNGWSGWYKGWFFRSLSELSYMVNIIEKQQLNWKNAECKILTIPYIDHCGTKRTYRADFLIEGKTLVEIKPKKLMSTELNILKKEAAEKFCEKKDFIYSMEFEFVRLSDAEIYELRQSGAITFTDRYEKKFIDKYIQALLK